MAEFTCPYCGSANDFTEDLPAGGKVTVDCEVCCRPIVVRVKSSSSGVDIDVRAEND